MTNLAIETLKVGKIPTLVAVPANAHRCPVVFVVPGYGMAKEACLGLAYRLAGRGVACIGFDPIYHGERHDRLLFHAYEPELGGIFPQETGLDIYLNFLRCIRQSSLDIASLMEHFVGDPRLDVSRAGVTGHSQGGYASFLALADSPTLRAAVPMMGLPTFMQRWQDVLDESAWSNSEWGEAIARVTPEIRERSKWIPEVDPATRLPALPPRPLLIMNGDFDTDQPKLYVLHWLRTLRNAYAEHPEMLKWNVYPAAHVMTDQMQDDAVAWFEEWL
jgi:uncharacterized protein